MVGKTATRMFCDIKTERKFTVGFGKILWNWAAEIFSKSKNALKFYNMCRQSYKPSRNLRRIKYEFSTINLFMHYRKMEDKPTFSYFSRSGQIWRTWFFLLTLITFRKSRNGAIGILRKLYLDNKFYDMRETISKIEGMCGVDITLPHITLNL